MRGVWLFVLIFRCLDYGPSSLSSKINIGCLQEGEAPCSAGSIFSCRPHQSHDAPCHRFFSTVLNLPRLLYFWLLTWSNISICRNSLQEMKIIFHFVGIDIFPVMYSLGSQNQSTFPDFLRELFSNFVKLVSTLNFCIPTSSNIFRIHIHNFLWFFT